MRSCFLGKIFIKNNCIAGLRNYFLGIILTKKNQQIGLFYIYKWYYNDESHYVLTDIPINDIYNVEIKLTDGKKHLLGAVKALSEEKIESIECEEQGDLNKNTVVKWKDLKSIDELSIHASTLLKKPPKRDDGSDNSKDKYYKYKDEIVKKIGPSGELTFPKSEYVDKTSTVTGFELEFRSTKFGKINTKLLENSSITISSSIRKNINLEKEE